MAADVASTRKDAPAVQHHCAGTALALIAAFFCACQSQVFTQRIKERGADVEGDMAFPVIYFQRDFYRIPRIRDWLQRRSFAPV